jgi:hypothetical protein
MLQGVVALVAAALCLGVGLSRALAAGDAAGAAPATAPGKGVDPKAAFEKLKGLAGEWKGHAGKPDGDPTSVILRVTGAGTALVETLFPGTDHEMVSVYYLEGRDLVMVHYCAAGNQPKLRLDAAKSTDKELVFDFAGGSNLDPAKDMHIHSARIRPSAPDRLEEDWIGWSEGKEAGAEKLFLVRKQN